MKEKEIYQEPCIEVVELELEQVIAGSAFVRTNNTVMDVVEDGGTYSTDGDSANGDNYDFIEW